MPGERLFQRLDAERRLHADRDLLLLQQPHERHGGELATLIGVENPRLAVPGQRFIHGVETELRLQRNGQPPRQDPPAEPIHHRRQIGKPRAIGM